MKEQLLNKFNNQIECYKHAATILEGLIEAAKPFDGKFINKRFANALSEFANTIDDNIECRVYLESYENYMYVKLIIFNSNASYDTFSVGRWGDVEKYIKNIDKRLDYKAFVHEIEREIKRIREEQAEYEKSISLFDAKQAEFNKLNQAYKEFEASLPYPIKTRVRGDYNCCFGYFGL